MYIFFNNKLKTFSILQVAKLVRMLAERTSFMFYMECINYIKTFFHFCVILGK